MESRKAMHLEDHFMKSHEHPATFKMDNQQRPIVQHIELCSKLQNIVSNTTNNYRTYGNNIINTPIQNVFGVKK